VGIDFLSFLMRRLVFLLPVFITACTATKKIHWPARTSFLTGDEFYHQAFSFNWAQRDSLAVKEILSGNIPSFLKKFSAIHVSVFDSATGEKIKATYYVAADYLCVGTNRHWARINITPMAAQKIADSLQCFVPTKKMVDDIYKAAKVKLEPVPMYAFRDSTPTMWHHHLIIEGQRGGRKGLIAGIQKDVVISGKILRELRPNRVAIYGWHKTDGTVIQPLFTGHVNWYVDYSHGTRLVYRKIKIKMPNRPPQWLDYTEVLSNERLRRLLCDEPFCDFFRYPY